MKLHHFPAPHTPHATVLLCHGYAEHRGRYEWFIGKLTQAGFDCYIYDHACHGEAPGPRAQVDVAKLIDAHHHARRQVLSQMRTDRLFLFGHSMGGLVAAASAQQDPSNIAGVMLSGPAFLLGSAVPVRLAKVLRKVANIAPGLPTTKLDAAGLSHNQQNIADYKADPANYTGAVPLLTASSMILEGTAVLHTPWPEVPALIMHGAEDKLADVAGSRHLAASSPHIQLVEVAGGYHEILNDDDKDAIAAQFIQWAKANESAPTQEV